MNINDEHRILISRPDRIGDVVLATALPREIKKKFPESFVAVLVRKYTKEVFVNNPNVDEIICVEPDELQGLKKLFQWVGKIRKYNFSHAFMLLPNSRINYLLFWAGIKTRIGVGHKFFQFITNTKSVFRNKQKPLRHEADYCLDFLKKIGIETLNYSSEIHLTNEEIEKAENVRKLNNSKNKKIIGVHATSGGSSPNMLPGEYLQLLKLLDANPHFEVIVTDYNIPFYTNELSDVKFPKDSIRDLFVTIKSLDLLISASTGPMHIAGALKTPTISLFCPLPGCSPFLWSPVGNYANFILPAENYCKYKCPKDPKKCYFVGEGGINAEKLYSEILNFFQLQQ